MDKGEDERSEFEGTLEYVAARWHAADRATLRHAFALLAEGRAVASQTLAEQAGVSDARARSALESGPIGLDAEGKLDELFGIMLDPTLHRVEIENRTIFTCCAVIAHTLPMLLDRPVTVESVDPLSRRIVRLRLHPDSVERLEPSGAVACFPTTPDGTHFTDVREAFCSHLKHFADLDSAREFAALNARRRIVSVVEMHALARRLVDRIWPN